MAGRSTAAKKSETTPRFINRTEAPRVVELRRVTDPHPCEIQVETASGPKPWGQGAMHPQWAGHHVKIRLF